MEYKVAKMIHPIKIDGDWCKSAWEKIEAISINQHMGESPLHRPDVSAKMTWYDTDLYIIFHVEDRFVRAVAEKHQDPVCKDSCVEFFFTPGLNIGQAYFNLEVNCGGTMLFSWSPEGKERIYIGEKECRCIEIGHTLPKIVDPEIKTPITWSVEYKLPFAIIRQYCPEAVKPAKGEFWKANFYKCADATSHPHWLTWAFVDYPTPKFHMPQYFGTLIFE